MVEEVIRKVPCSISKTLYDEITRAKNTLDSIEKQKRMGKKKKNWTFIGASHRVGQYLYQKRLEKKSGVKFDDMF